MNPHPPTASGPEGTCRQNRDTLVRLERAGPEDGSPREALDSLEAHLDACADCRSRYVARLDRLQGLQALRERSAPDGTFDDFYAQLSERIPFAPAGGGMSPAFLDAPRSLRVWRGAALAASLLFAATVGFAFTRGGGADPAAAVRPLHDPRGNLLEAYDTRPDIRSIRPVRDASRRGHGAFYTAPDVEVTPVGHGWK